MQLEGRYRLLRLSETDGVDEHDVIEFWQREGAMPATAAGSDRVAEVAFVALEEREGLVGLSTVYLKHSPQLRMDLWHYRTYVTPPHRRRRLAEDLIVRTRDHLEAQFVSGEDLRAPGMLVLVQNEMMREVMREAVRPRSRFAFIGTNARGDHCRVYYFPGALVPPPG